MRETDVARPLVSVVTPFFNTAQFLAQCIESVLAQTYETFEYILVDNQSNDGSTGIAEHYAAQDSRIRLVKTNTFLGQVENYNFALEQISKLATYVKIVQADDLIVRDCLERMVEVAERAPEIALVSAYYVKDDTPMGGGVAFGTWRVAGRELCRQMLLTFCFPIGSPTAVMYRADVVRQRQPFFALDKHHEDTETAYEILLNSDFGFVHQILSYLRTQESSTMARIAGFNGGVLDHLIVLERFGKCVLSPEEFRAELRREWSAYRGYLGVCAIFRRSSEFWQFHRSGLATIGYRLQRREVRRFAIKAALFLALNPLDTVRHWSELRALRDT